MDEGEPSDSMDLLSDFDLELFSSHPDACSAMFNIQSSPRPTSLTTGRRQWGTGREASLTAVYRHYDLSQSPAFYLLGSDTSNLTIEQLLQLIHQIRESIPAESRPKGPSRTQRRVKVGLIAWLDMNWKSSISFLLKSRFARKN
jgi:hypothetical protein